MRLALVPSDERWAAFVHSRPDAGIFHHPAWMDLLAECYGYRPFVVAGRDEKGEISAGLPVMEVKSFLTGLRWISLPFTDHCGPLFNDEAQSQELFEFLYELGDRQAVPRIEIRAAIPHDGQGYEDSNQVLHQLQLSSDAEGVFRGFHKKKVRGSIARAEREGVQVRWAQDKRDMDVFYDLHLRTRRRLGVPIQPKRYFDLLWQRIIEPGLGFVLLAYMGDIAIAAGVFLTYKTTLTYKYGASDRDYGRFCPNHLLLWTAIQWACEHNCTIFDWGKTSVDNTGLRRFKDGWGAQESILSYSVLSSSPPSHNTDRLSGIVGPVIRSAPSSVCRIAGELLYRHFA